MRLAPSFIFATLVLLLLTACGGKKSEPLHQEHLMVFGTIVDISVYGGDEAVVYNALQQIEDDLDYLHQALHAWEAGSLGRTNQLIAATGTFTAPPSVLPLIEQSQQIYRASDGLFNPAIGHLVALWGFHGDDPQRPPPAEEISALLAAAPSMDDLAINGVRLHNRNPAVRLDLGAIAKGYAVDRAVETLHSAGLHHVIVNAGGDLRASGRRGDRPWRIGIRDPRGPGILASIEIVGDESLFTSGDYERFFEVDGVRYHHILDPRSGQPARGLTSVTVLGNDGAAADAAATALLIAGPHEWPRIAAALGFDKVMVVDSAGAIQATPAMAERITLESSAAQATLERVPLP